MRRLALDLAPPALLGEFSLHRTRALVRVHAGHAPTTPIAHALLPAVPAATPTRCCAGQSAGCSCAHGRVLALEALASPGVGEAEGVEMLFVFLLRWLAVLGPGHGLAGLVDIAGPSLMRVCGVGLGEVVVAVVVDVAGAPEEGLGFCADSHCAMCVLGESLRVTSVLPL